MSRVSLNRRIERLRDHLLPPGSLTWRIDQLGEAEQRSVQLWQENCAALNLHAESTPGAAFRAMIEGKLASPILPRRLRYELWPEMERIEAELDAAVAYQMMLEGL